MVNKEIEQFKEDIKGKRIAIVGFGVSNQPLARYLSAFGVRITVFDRRSKEQIGDVVRELRSLGVEFSLGEDYLSGLENFDLIFRTPGMRYDMPEFLRETERGAELTSEMEVFFKLCPAPIIAVTGSDGKTTTTTLIYKMLSQEGYNCWLGGNIGTPLLDKIDEIRPSDKVVLELSSFQLHTMKHSPQTAIITNLSPNHLDIHRSLDEYVEAKKSIFIYQNSCDKLILNWDNEITRGFEDEARGDVIFFSREKELKKGAYVNRKKQLIFSNGDREDFIVNSEDIMIPGLHNVENYLAAICAVIDDVSVESIKLVATTFGGVEHRIELVRQIRGISFYNDSIGSSPTRTKASVNAFSRKVILIAGGYDKKIPYSSMGRLIHDRVKYLVLMGDTGPKIEKAYFDYLAENGITKAIPIFNAVNMEDAVSKSFLAGEPGDIVILSPASASFDMYTNFAERGNHFKSVVRQLGL